MSNRLLAEKNIFDSLADDLVVSVNTCTNANELKYAVIKQMVLHALYKMGSQGSGSNLQMLTIIFWR